MSGKPRPLLPLLDELKENLIYDPETGCFYWKYNRVKIKSGQRAEKLCSGGRYYSIFWNGVKYLAHRVAWLIMTKTEPPDELDHENLNGLDNRWANIREATHSQNLANIFSRNSNGFKGVGLDKRSNRYMAQILVNGKRIHLGCFSTAEEAGEAYEKGVYEYFGKFARY